MKQLKKWKYIFWGMCIIFLFVLIKNLLTPSLNLSVEMIARRPIYISLTIIFLVAAIVMDIVKAAIKEEREK